MKTNMDTDDLALLIFFILILCALGLYLMILGLKGLGVIKHKTPNKRKWTKTNARIVKIRNAREKTGKLNVTTLGYLGFGAGKTKSFREAEIVYSANGTKYTKYIRDLPNGRSVPIYYKNKNPNCFKTLSEAEHGVYLGKPACVFMTFIGAVILISGIAIILSVL